MSKPVNQFHHPLLPYDKKLKIQGKFKFTFGIIQSIKWKNQPF